MANQTSSVHVHLGRTIRALRVRRGLSQEALGERAGLSDKFIGEIERGVGNPTVASLGSLADALGVNVGAFFEGADANDADFSYPMTPSDFETAREAVQSLSGFLKRLEPAQDLRGRKRGRKV